MPSVQSALTVSTIAALKTLKPETGGIDMRKVTEINGTYDYPDSFYVWRAGASYTEALPGIVESSVASGFWVMFPSTVILNSGDATGTAAFPGITWINTTTNARFISNPDLSWSAIAGTVGGSTTLTTTGFTQPTLGSTVTVNVSDSSIFAVGQYVFIETAGNYSVLSKPGATQLGLRLESAIAAPAATITTGKLVAPSGEFGYNVEVRVTRAADLAGTIDPTKVYFIDGVIDLLGTSIEVPASGLTIKGTGFNTSKLIDSSAGYVMFTSPVGGSGDLILEDIAIEVTGTGSSVFGLTAATGNEAVEIKGVNYNGCTSLGYLDDYRHLLETETGRFGGSPELEFRNDWNVARFDTTIVRNVTLSTALFKAGTGLAFSGRFITNINVDLPATGALLDFAPANITNDESLKFEGAFVTRLGVADASDTTIIPNIDETSVKSLWRNNVGLRNTNKYIQARISTEVATAIAAADTYYPLAGTYTVSDSSHFSLVSNGIFELLSGSGRYNIILNYTLQGTADDSFAIQCEKSTDGGATWTPVDHKIAKIQNLVGGVDVGALGSNFNTNLDKGDRLRLQIENYTAARNITALIDSSISIAEM